jgi:hypothetical protein
MKFFARPKTRPEVSISRESMNVVREIMELQSFYGSDIVGSVYFYAGSKVLGAPISDCRGMLLEKSPPIVSEELTEADALGRLALGTLLSFRTLSDSGAAPRGKSDWSTYVGSGAKSNIPL